MSLTAWLSGGAESAARTLAQTFCEQFPASMEAMKGRKTLEIRDRAIIRLLDEAIALQRERRMGILRKILFIRAFQAALVDAGYSDDMVRPLVSELSSKITFANR